MNTDVTSAQLAVIVAARHVARRTALVEYTREHDIAVLRESLSRLDFAMRGEPEEEAPCPR